MSHGGGHRGTRTARVFALTGAASGFAAPALACPFCDIGVRDTWNFILLVVGAFILGAATLLLWSVRSGHYRDGDAIARRVLELDRQTGVRR